MEFFKPEDFNNIRGFSVQPYVQQEFANLCNAKLEDKGIPVWSSKKNEYEQWRPCQNTNDTHSAILIGIKEITPCKHEANEVVLSGKWTGFISGAIGSCSEGELIKPTTLLSPVCKHCGKKLKPVKWESEE